MLVFLSAGYFKSGNCRRELYAAVEQGKPLVVVREGNEEKGGGSAADFRAECVAYCSDAAAGVAEVVAAVFTREPIVWLRAHEFQHESLKQIAHQLLAASPSFACPAGVHQLAPGLFIPGELGCMRFEVPVHLLVCEANAGAPRFATKL